MNNLDWKELEQFVNEQVRPHAGRIEEEDRLPVELISEMARRGYLGAPLPRQYGGQGLDQVTYGRLMGELGRGCPTTRSLLTVHTSIVGETVARWGTEEQKQQWLPALASGRRIGAFALTEPEVGSDARSVRTEYRREGDIYILSGRKKFISFAGLADAFLVVARSADADSVGALTVFWVDKSDRVVLTPMSGLLAARAAQICEIQFNQVRVPVSHVIGREGAAFPYIVGTALDAGRYSVAWGGVGIAEAALDAMVSYAKQRRQFDRPLYEHQLIREMLANAATQLEAGRALCLEAGRLRDAGAIDAPVRTTLAKYFTSRAAMTVTTDAVQLHGGNGCWNQYPVERLFREAKILEIIEGSSQIQQKLLSDYALQAYG